MDSKSKQLYCEDFWDCIAKPKKHISVLSNITECIKSADKIKIIDCLNCDEKYINGQASDFELFEEWERILPMCVGTGAERLYREELRFLNLEYPKTPQTRATVCDRWERGNQEIRSSDFSEPSNTKNASSYRTIEALDLTEFVTNFVESCKDKNVGLKELLTESEKKINRGNNAENAEIHFVIDFTNMEYTRPDPYHSECALKKMLCDEKLYKSEFFSVTAQLLILLVAKGEKERKNFCLHFYSEGTLAPISAVSSVLRYLRERRLFHGQIRLGVFPDSPVEDWSSLCGRWDTGTFVRPELLLRSRDFTSGLTERLERIFSEYPVGGMRFGGCLTDSPLYFVWDRFFIREFFEPLLERMCEAEENKQALLKIFLDRK